MTSPKAALPPRETAYDGLLFAATITLGSFLVFQVQPLIGRFILPWFGSSPGVWTTCMLFFQALLLAGYAYAHVLSVRLSPRAQTLLHIALLVAAALTLPITPSAAFKPTDASDPSARILLLLLVSVGAPYLLLASGAPLVQRWYARARPSASPYRLYSLSNIGSLLALLSYPLVFERLWSLETQTTSWSWAFIAYGLLCTLCALRSRSRNAHERRPAATSAIATEDLSAAAARVYPTPTPAPPPIAVTPAREQDHARVPWRDLALWIALSACGSVMLLAATNQICLDIAVTPMLWVVPLALYLLSFVICFDNERWYSRPLFAGLFVLSLGLVGPTILLGPELGIAWQLLVHCAALFTACMLCHGELYRLRPPPRRLTLFYLAVAAGGCLGGLLVALVAPRVFTGYYEYHVGLALVPALLVLAVRRERQRRIEAGGAPPRVRLGYEVWMGAAVILVVDLHLLLHARGWEIRRSRDVAGAWQLQDLDEDTVARGRNFYGLMRVVELNASWPENHHRAMLHGRINHGFQYLRDDKRRQPTSYFGETSGLGHAIALHPRRARGQTLRLGVLGLGVGTIASYAREGDAVEFYEINPLAIELAHEHFHYLGDARRRGASLTVHAGDARLLLERQLREGAPRAFDVLAVDAFSGDAPPIHLLTRECFGVYLEHLAPGGVLALNVSNRFVDLKPVVRGLAEDAGLRAVHFHDTSSRDAGTHTSDWMLVTANQLVLDSDEFMYRESEPDAGAARPPVLWTDDHSSLLGLMIPTR